MWLGRDGLTTVECLIALVVFTVGMLGAAGTTALAVRQGAAGTRAASAARLAVATLDSLRGSVSAAGGRCSALASGSATGQHATSAEWTVSPERAGRAVRLTVSYPTTSGRHRDALWSFLSCR
jgi:Tfp pilus assembly protein PilV